MKKDVLLSVMASERDRCLSLFGNDIGYFLSLLKLVIPNVAKLEEVAATFILYSDVRIHSTYHGSNHLILFEFQQNLNDDPKNSMNKTEIKYYYIAIEQQLILVIFSVISTYLETK